MKLVGRIPVEPLDNERMTNIERRIVAGAADAAARQPIRESRAGLVVAFALVTVLVLGAGLVGWQLRGGGGDTGATTVAEVPLTIRTDDFASTIDVGDARIASSAATAFTITRPDGKVVVALERGKVGLEVGKRGDRPPLIVRAGDTDVVVVGTEFTVNYDPGRAFVDVRVTEGVVRVERQGKDAVRVAAGDAWQTDRGVVALATLDTVDTVADDLEIEIGTPPNVALRDRTAKVPEARVTTSGKAVAQPERRIARPQLDNPADPYYDLKTALRSKIPVLAPATIGITDPHAAIAKYREAITGPGASHALYSIAYVQYMKLGQAADALQTLERYRQRFQDGDEYQAAMWLRVRILCLANLDEQCRAAAYTYMAVGSGKSLEIAQRITESPR